MKKTLLFILILISTQTFAKDINESEDFKARTLPQWEIDNIQASLKNANNGNPTKGEQLHHKFYCSACHGKTGESPSPNWPSLSSNPTEYTFKTLKDYQAGARRDGYRKAEIMQKISKWLNDEQIADLSSYYATQTKPYIPTSAKKLNKKENKEAESISNNGILKRNIAPCAACHGENGDKPISLSIPNIAGQMPEYFIKTMNEYKQQHRASDYDGVMREVAGSLTTKEIENLAHYFANKGK